MRTFFDRFEEYVLLILFPLMVVVVFAATLARYFNLFPMFWGEEVARYIMVFMAYIGAGLAMKKGAHVGVNFFTGLVKNLRLRIFLETFRIVVIVSFALMIMYYYRQLILHQMSMGQTTPALFIPMGIPYSAVPLGMFLVGLRAFQGYRGTIADLRAEASSPSEVK